MCGIAGIVSQQLSASELSGAAEAVIRCLSHRGPDDQGLWFDHQHGVALCQRRLAILDLSPEGHQPMHSPSRRFTITFNGEVYNFLSLRQELQKLGFSFRGGSDTEVMLAAFEAWGVEAATKRFNGMFAFALWDAHEKRLVLGRDRLGIKPLYYGWTTSGFLFSSEIKSFEQSPQFRNEIDRSAVTLFLRFNYIPAPWSIYHNIFKLPQGCLLSFSPAEMSRRPGDFSPDYLEQGMRLRPQQYWSAKSAAEQGQHSPRPDNAETLEALHQLMLHAVKLRMVADVPLGAFLSGGIDSSTVVALMQAQSGRPVKTYSIGFHEGAYNEAAHAKAVAQHLKTEHTELYVTPEDALNVIPSLSFNFDEPFADSSQIPTMLLSKLTRQHVTVSLSGDGGDELFAGYARYVWAEKVRRTIGLIPSPIRKLTSAGIRVFSREQWDAMFHLLRPLTPSRLRVSLPGDKMHKLARVLNYNSGHDVYAQMVSHWNSPAELVIDGTEPPVNCFDPRLQPNLPDYISRMMFFDLMGYLPDGVMVKVDRASMAASLEAREPLLDYRLVEFAWSLPLAMKLRGGVSKWALRQILYRYVPRELVERPKMGFGVPIDGWLRGPLRAWAEELLSETALKRTGLLHPAPIRQKWQQHLKGTHNWQYHIWDVLMLQDWCASRGR